MNNLGSPEFPAPRCALVVDVVHSAFTRERVAATKGDETKLLYH